jgi:hypothetical protein
LTKANRLETLGQLLYRELSNRSFLHEMSLEAL